MVVVRRNAPRSQILLVILPFSKAEWGAQNQSCLEPSPSAPAGLLLFREKCFDLQNL